MTITLSQVSQLSGITAISSFSINETGRAVVLNPTQPALIFDYAPGGSGITVAVVLGSSNITASLYSDSNLLVVNQPPLWFANAILTGGGVCAQSGCMQNGSSACGPWFAVYNTSSGSYNENCTALPSNSITTQFLDVTIDFANQYVYLWFSSSSTPAGVIVRIPLSSVSTLVNNLQVPSGYQVAFIQPSSPPSGFTVYKNQLVLYNGNFYIQGLDSSGNWYIWVVPYSSITWNSSFPSSAQSVGSTYAVYTGGSADMGSIFLNYYIYNGSLVTEILCYIPTNFNSSGKYYANVYIYSFNPSTNSATQLFSLQNANVKLVAINIYGVIAFVQNPSSGTFTVSTYDRKTNTYQQSSQISALDVKLAEPYYAVVFSGSASSLTITIYQILLDVMPAFKNVTLSGSTLTGQVVNLNGGSPLAGITVYLYQLSSQNDDASSGTQVASTTTDSNGNFSFTISSSGYYALKVIQSA